MSMSAMASCAPRAKVVPGPLSVACHHTRGTTITSPARWVQAYVGGAALNSPAAACESHCHVIPHCISRGGVCSGGKKYQRFCPWTTPMTAVPWPW